MLEKIRKWICPWVCLASQVAETFIEVYNKQGKKTKILLWPLYLIALGVTLVAFMVCGCGL